MRTRLLGVVLAALVFTANFTAAEETDATSAENARQSADNPFDFGDGTPRAGADRQPGAGQMDFCHCVGHGDAAAVAKIRRVLRSPLQPTGLDFKDVPLEEAVYFLQDEYGIPIQLDTPALEGIGLGPDEPVTVNLHNISLGSALNLMLKQLQLAYSIRDEVLLITSPEEAESDLDICVYDVRELVSKNTEKATERLKQTILRCVAKETWSKHGGNEAEIQIPRAGILVISQTQAVHEEIRRLLRALRDIQSTSGLQLRADQAAADGGPPG